LRWVIRNRVARPGTFGLKARIGAHWIGIGGIVDQTFDFGDDDDRDISEDPASVHVSGR
jgi:hypothetical protein